MARGTWLAPAPGPAPGPGNPQPQAVNSPGSSPGAPGTPDSGNTPRGLSRQTNGASPTPSGKPNASPRATFGEKPAPEQCNCTCHDSGSNSTVAHDGGHSGGECIPYDTGSGQTTSHANGGAAKSGFFSELGSDVKAHAVAGLPLLAQGTPLGPAARAYDNYKQQQARLQQAQSLRDAGHSAAASIAISAGNELGEMLGTGDFESVLSGRNQAGDHLTLGGRAYRFGMGLFKWGSAVLGVKGVAGIPRGPAARPVSPVARGSKVVPAELVPEPSISQRTGPSAQRLADDAAKARNYPYNNAPRTTRPVSPPKGQETLQPGPFAKESIPAHRGRPTAAEQRQVNELMEKHGCHTCGTKKPGTKSGNAIADHQPPEALGDPKEFYPHCIDCQRRQGGQVLQEKLRRCRK